MVQTIIRNVCLSAISEFCLSVVVCSASTTYTSLCRGLKYLLKVRFIILVYPNVARFSIFKTLCLGKSKTLSYVWINKNKSERHLCLVTNSFTKLNQNVYNQYGHFDISICQMQLQVMEGFYCVFWVF